MSKEERINFDQLRELAKGFYSATWSKTDDFEKARDLLEAHMKTLGMDDLHDAIGEAGGSAYGSLITEYSALCRWPEFGHPHIVIGAQRAAQFALTRIGREAVEGLTLPWPALYVSLPAGLLTTYSPYSGEQESLDRLLILQHQAHDKDPARQQLGVEAGTTFFSWVASTAQGLSLNRSCMLAEHFASPFDDRGDDGFLDCDLDEQDARVLTCIDRLIVGLCLYMDDPDIRKAAEKRATGKTARKKGKRYPSGLLNYVLSDTVAVDARNVFSEYIKHGGKSPTVRSFVRPHWQRYKVGKGRLDTILKHRDGFFRGPKKAPLSVSTYRIPEPRNG